MTIETDYLVVGAGAMGMAFADALVARCDAEVVLVDRHHSPGGHWNDDYPFVRLHQPSAFYGVDSTPLGSDAIDATGFYERASGAEMRDYYARVLAERFLPTGRVRFLGMHEHRGGSDSVHGTTSLLTGKTTEVLVRRRIVDATYIQTTLPSMHKPAFSIDPGARLVTPNDLVRLPEPGSAFTVIGAGKTSMDTCCWLIDSGVAPDSIRWIRPRDPYVVDRAWTQPLSRVGSFLEWLARQNEAAAVATDPRDLMRRLADNEVFLRLDPDVEPSVYRGATLDAAERAQIARIGDVVRLGRVIRAGVDHIELAGGSLPTRPGEVYVDCSAPGLGTPPARTVFESGRITIQRVQAGIDPFSAALIGVVEATDRDDAEKNRLCPPNPVMWDTDDFARAMLVTLRARAGWQTEPDIRDWDLTTRLSPFRDLQHYLTDRSRAALVRLLAGAAPAMENLERIVNGTH